jgi:hypothetical protein
MGKFVAGFLFGIVTLCSYSLWAQTQTNEASGGTLTLCPGTTYYGTPVGCAEMASKQVCHTVWDDTIVYTVNCGAFISTEYVCPKNGEPCYTFYKADPAFRNCGRATKEVCGPPEMFHDEDPTTQAVH